jgi:hypothetical protein
VALLYRSRRSVERVRERRDEEGGRDVGQGVVEERRRRRGVGRSPTTRAIGLRRYRSKLPTTAPLVAEAQLTPLNLAVDIETGELRGTTRWCRATTGTSTACST